jgi:hypothetical protein
VGPHDGGWVRIEVKSAAYLQTWGQKSLSRNTFNVPKTLGWDADTGEYAAAAQRHAHVHVFALLHHTDKLTVNPLDLDQWIFYVLPTQALNDRTRSQQSIMLRALQALTAPATFSELRESVSAAHTAAQVRRLKAAEPNQPFKRQRPELGTRCAAGITPCAALDSTKPECRSIPLRPRLIPM